jgi:RNA polymerase sigma-70 factor (ECF subfamily)
MLRARKSRREEPLSLSAPEPAAVHRTTTDPEHEALLADSVGLALLVVLETLPPAERVAFVLHDMFAVPFDEIAPIVGRSSVATRQLASRARRRVQGAGPTSDSDLARRRQVVDAFLAASRRGDFQALLAVLDPEVVLRADDAVVQMGGPRDVRGERAVAETFSGRAQAARLALVDGAPGAVWTVDGRPRVVFLFTVANGKIVAIDMLADPEVTERLELISLED